MYSAIDALVCGRLVIREPGEELIEVGDVSPAELVAEREGALLRLVERVEGGSFHRHVGSHGGVVREKCRGWALCGGDNVVAEVAGWGDIVAYSSSSGKISPELAVTGL